MSDSRIKRLSVETTEEATRIISLALLGSPCTYAAKEEYSWHLSFGNEGTAITLECPWRILRHGSIAFGYEDHNQIFGLPAPLNGPEEIKRLFSDAPVAEINIRAGCADIRIAFGNGSELEAFNYSGGYEGWTFSDVKGFIVVA